MDQLKFRPKRREKQSSNDAELKQLEALEKKKGMETWMAIELKENERLDDLEKWTAEWSLRSGMDAVLLFRICGGETGKAALDLGTGTGSSALSLRKNAGRRFSALEIQDEIAEMGGAECEEVAGRKIENACRGGIKEAAGFSERLPLMSLRQIRGYE